MSKQKIHEGIINRFISAIYKAALGGKVAEIDKAIKAANKNLKPEDKKKIKDAIEQAQEILRNKK